MKIRMCLGLEKMCCLVVFSFYHLVYVPTFSHVVNPLFLHCALVNYVWVRDCNGDCLICLFNDCI